LVRDPALEAWSLITTVKVSEQLEQSLAQKCESVGVPLVILDWKGDGLPDLAALCAFAPDLVTSIFSAEAGGFAEALQPIADNATERTGEDCRLGN
jgi:hypothetical protein